MEKIKKDVRPYGECVECGKYGELTGEHIFAAWIGRHIHDTQEFTDSFLWTDQRFVRTRIDNRSERASEHGHANAKLAILCKACNNELGSALQDAVSAVMKPLLNGEQWWVSDKNRQLIASWISSFVMTRQFVHPELAAISSEQRLKFHTTRLPFENLSVWIAPFHGTESMASWYRGFYMNFLDVEETLVRIVKDPVVKNSFILVVTIGKLVFLVFGLADKTMGNMAGSLWIKAARCAESLGLTRLWPTYSAFPTVTPASLGDADLEQVALSFALAFDEGIGREQFIGAVRWTQASTLASRGRYVQEGNFDAR
ncbi:hypothetical protein RugamoR64_22950 [Duganella rhizosphaerae]|uniref:hypothetical protein n=1 Tax=Duganella rhizosphaerae TaxID=2885763 RepID=UPI0030EA11F3